MKWIRRIEAATGLYVVRAVRRSNEYTAFITDDHVHYWLTPRTMEFGLEDDPRCSTPMCEWLFGPHARARDEWGAVDLVSGRWHVVG